MEFLRDVLNVLLALLDRPRLKPSSFPLALFLAPSLPSIRLSSSAIVGSRFEEPRLAEGPNQPGTDPPRRKARLTRPTGIPSHPGTRCRSSRLRSAGPYRAAPKNSRAKCIGPALGRSERLLRGFGELEYVLRDLIILELAGRDVG